MKKLYQILRILLWCLIGVFTGSSIYQYYDYTKHPDLYVLTSAPWYLSIQISGTITFIAVLLILCVMWVVKRKMKEGI